jgi:hypothetical protein
MICPILSAYKQTITVLYFVRNLVKYADRIQAITYIQKDCCCASTCTYVCAVAHAIRAHSRLQNLRACCNHAQTACEYYCIHRENGVNDMVELYCERGMAVADAQTVVGALSKYDKFFVDVMLSEELGLPNYKVLNFVVTSAFN